MTTPSENKTEISRIGLHYYSDTLHYRIDDLKHWLPVFKNKNIHWLVLKADIKKAIPEFFIKALIKAAITPIIEFNLPIDQLPQTKDFLILLQVYARWGVKYILLFDRPNQKSSWRTSSWTQQDLVDRFLDQYIPITRQVLEQGLTPIFPPLEPGGNYWDTAFLRGVLKGLQRRKQESILENLVLSAYAHTKNHPLQWGIGGPERWPQTRPYLTPEGSEDQQGFRIFDWYQSISQAILQKRIPMILLQGAFPDFPEKFLNKGPLSPIVWENQARIMQSLTAANAQDEIGAEILCCNFWLLSAEESDPFYAQAWFQGEHCLIPEIPAYTEQMEELLIQEARTETNTDEDNSLQSPTTHPIQHYVLLPTYSWGIADWHLEIIQPYIKKHRATIGFSIEEAMLAKQVTIIGSQSFSEEEIQQLKQSGSLVEQFNGDGMSIATFLSERQEEE